MDVCGFVYTRIQVLLVALAKQLLYILKEKTPYLQFFLSLQFPWSSWKPINTLSYIGQEKTGNRNLNVCIFLDLFK